MKHIYLFTLLVLMSITSQAQYTINGSAIRESCRCYTLTSNNTYLQGTVWNNNRINLSQDFDFNFQVKIGRAHV